MHMNERQASFHTPSLVTPHDSSLLTSPLKPCFGKQILNPFPPPRQNHLKVSDPKA